MRTSFFGDIYYEPGDDWTADEGFGDIDSVDVNPAHLDDLPYAEFRDHEGETLFNVEFRLDTPVEHIKVELEKALGSSVMIEVMG